MVSIKLLALLLLIASAIARPPVEGEKRLIKLNDEDPGQWLDEEGINSLIRNKVHFMDITGRVFPVINHDLPASKAIPTTLRFQDVVLDTIPNLSVVRMKAFLTQFSAYHNRHYQSATGVASSEWLLAQVSESIANSMYRGNATVRAITHSWAQKSVIARIEGADPMLRSEVVILGAHLDSITSSNPNNGVQPGADDNGSGSVAILEAFRVMLDNQVVPKRSIEFQWYAAEEVGLRGSADIAESYYDQRVNVTGMMNFDIVGYYTPGRNQLAIYTDRTSAPLNQFLRLVIEGYLNFTWVNRVCGYGCSDHASWNTYGFPAAFPAELVDNPYMHTVNDMITRVDFPQVTEFVKLAIGYCIELAEPSM